MLVGNLQGREAGQAAASVDTASSCFVALLRSRARRILRLLAAGLLIATGLAAVGCQPLGGAQCDAARRIRTNAQAEAIAHDIFYNGGAVAIFGEPVDPGELKTSGPSTFREKHWWGGDRWTVRFSVQNQSGQADYSYDIDECGKLASYPQGTSSRN